MIKCLLTESGRDRWENIWLLVIMFGPRCTRAVRHDLEPNIFPSGPPTQSVSTYYSENELIELCINLTLITKVPFKIGVTVFLLVTNMY